MSLGSSTTRVWACPPQIKAPACYIHVPAGTTMTVSKCLVFRTPNFQAPGKEQDRSIAGQKNITPSSPVGTHGRTGKPPDTRENRAKGCIVGLQVTNQKPISSANALWGFFYGRLVLYSKWLGREWDRHCRQEWGIWRQDKLRILQGCF